MKQNNRSLVFKYSLAITLLVPVMGFQNGMFELLSWLLQPWHNLYQYYHLTEPIVPPPKLALSKIDLQKIEAISKVKHM